MYCQQCRFATKPTSSVWISSSVAVFLILTSFCIVLSLSSMSNKQNEENGHKDGDGETGVIRTKVARYVPNIAMFCFMSIGILAMVVFIVKRGGDTTSDDNDRETTSTSRHIRHRKISLYSLSAFFVGGFIFHLNYLMVEFFCTSKWTDCGAEILGINIFQVFFHVGCMVFISCETIVCWVMKNINFEPCPWIWHGLAVIQAANIAQWFDALLKETDHLDKNDTVVQAFYEQFTFCDNTTTRNQTRYEDDQCSTSGIAVWFHWSMPVLFPITIEFFLLVSENFLDRCVGTESHSLKQNDQERNNYLEHQASRRNASERTPLLPHSPNSNRWKMLIMITVIINIVYLVLSIVVFISHQLNNEDKSRIIDNVFMVCMNVYYLFLITCSVVGILRCREFRHQPLRVTFLEYLLLFATSGVLLQSIKRMVAFAFGSQFSGWIPVYLVAEFIDQVEPLLQIVLYFYARDVVLINDNMHMFKAIMIVISISNFTNWIIDSFLYANLTVSMTPLNDSIERWDVFDNAVNPISIFFRFNSALLFWCIGTDKPAELTQPETTGSWVWWAVGGLTSFLFTVGWERLAG